MTAATNSQAYKPYYELLDRALATEHGVQVWVRDWGEGRNMQVRLHQARTPLWVGPDGRSVFRC
jgi:hypothetical protein